MEFQDHYEVLSVPPTASQEQIERAYKRLVLIAHPDLYATDPRAQAWANDRMKLINGAYDVLRDPAKRAGYDRTYNAAKQAQANGSRERSREQQWEQPRAPILSGKLFLLGPRGSGARGRGPSALSITPGKA